MTRFEHYHSLAEKAEKRPSPIRNDGTQYHWQLDYDPAANAGKGQVRFSIKSDAAKPADFEGKIFAFDLPDGFKKLGTHFDHFGMINITRPGGSMSVYFGDLVLDGRRIDLSSDPHWDGSGNRENICPRKSPHFRISVTPPRCMSAAARAKSAG